MALSEARGNPGRGSNPRIELVYLRCNKWNNLYATTTNTNDGNAFSFDVHLRVVLCCVAQGAFKIKEAINLWPSPRAI